MPKHNSQITKDFKELSSKDVLLAGGKGASLGEMTQAGIPVPPGFVVLSAAFEKFLQATNLRVEIDSILHKVNHQEMHTVENAAEKIQALILNCEMLEDITQEVFKQFDSLKTKFVAVRSSATAEDSADAAWAGQLESYLNTDKKNLLKNIQKCWASLFTPRAIFYRFEKGLHGKHISVAVVVQKMIQSEVAGIAFSVHPVTQDYNQLIIEAGLGLGEAIVSGQITPDSYVVEKAVKNIIDKQIHEQSRGLYRSTQGGNEWRDIPKSEGEKPTLSDVQVLELSDLIVHIEKHYGFPCDIEWALEKKRFYIVQSRPITTLIKQLPQDKSTIKVNEIAHLHAPLSFIELQYEQEATENIPWAKEKFPIKPYIFHKKEGDQVYFYYDPVGVAWQMDQTAKYDDEKYAIDQIRSRFNEVANILKKEKALPPGEFKSFLEKIRGLWPWLNYMWWSIEYKDKNKQPFDAIMAVRKETEYFVPGLMAVLRKSIKRNFPDKAKYVDVLLLSEVERSNFPDSSVLENRLVACAYTNYRLYSSWSELVGDFRVQVSKSTEKNSDTLIGQTAFPGHVQGKVRIIATRKDMKSFKEGEILVASTTTPDFLPAMKKSAALISEHGGAICHAAITSRELEIPCVVGVAGATQILKNGDFVEVNATDGIIKILKTRTKA